MNEEFWANIKKKGVRTLSVENKPQYFIAEDIWGTQEDTHLVDQVQNLSLHTV